MARIDPDALNPVTPRKRQSLDDDADQQKTKKIRLALGPKPFNLTGLPGDILHIVANEHLESLDFFNLRLTSKHLRERTEKAFGRRYFKTKKFMLSPMSLNALLDISKHAQLGQFVRHISIGSERLQSNYLHAFEPASRSATEVWRKEYFEKYSTFVADQERMERNGDDVQILAQVFESLPNLESVSMGEVALVCPIKALRPFEDANLTQSWGVEKLIRELGAGDEPSFAPAQVPSVQRPHIPMRSRLLIDTTMGRAFDVMFKALREAGRELKVDLAIPRLPEPRMMPFDLEDGDVWYCLPMVRSLKFDSGWEVQERGTEVWVEQLVRDTVPTSVSLRHMDARSIGPNTPALRMLPVGFNAPLKTLKLFNLWEIDVDLLKTTLMRLAPSLTTLDIATVTISMTQNPTRRLRQWMEVFKVIRGLLALTSLSLADLYEYCDGNLLRDDPTDDAAKKTESKGWIYGIHLRGHKQIAQALSPDAYSQGISRESEPLIGVGWRKTMIGG
ncbi:hypothetical protein BU16DRAFT_527268 [Lophium mytilinum]|uniref:Uncharacterized protein n=1 Tax=Lophium mytilinum TaxID=390894 RepID=A0A6A6QT91_9PEZI|nr:hypothetical protein BU16DRAFT_527268 [Lophium mytilinum]